MKSLNSTRIFFLIASLIIVALGIFGHKEILGTCMLGAALIITMVVLDIKMPEITKLSHDNPKVKTARNINRMVLLVILCFIAASALNSYGYISLSDDNSVWYVGAASLFMLVFGNVAPKIPFNRYLGLRLPWTIRDEDTWKVAHKVVGYSAFPIAIVQFVLAFFIKPEHAAAGGILTWVVVPSLYSLWFYYNKYRTH